jgi:phage gpG-like protein
MQNFESFFRNILKDLKVELDDEFDRNFERKAFFDEYWPQTKWPVSRGSLMNRTSGGGGLRGSISSKIEADAIVWRSSKEYSVIHNDGGDITVTAAMISFFWAMYYKASGAASPNPSAGGAKRKPTQRQVKLTQEAAIWKALALQKPGSKMRIPRRRFIGDHPQVDASVRMIVDRAMKELEEILKYHLTQIKNYGHRY